MCTICRSKKEINPQVIHASFCLKQWFPTKGCEKLPSYLQEIYVFVTLLGLYSFLLQCIKDINARTVQSCVITLNYSRKHQLRSILLFTSL